MKQKHLHIIGFSLVFACSGAAVSAQTGPGGIGNTAGSSNLRIWLSANRGVYTNAGTTLATNGQSVQQWTDYSGYGVNATNPGTATTRPVLVTAGPNGFPTLQFTPASLQTLTAGFNISPGVTPDLSVIAVAVPNAVNTNLSKLWGHDDGGYDRTVGFDNRNGPFVYFHGTNAANYATPTANAYFISTATYTTTAFNGFFDGSLTATGGVSNGSGQTSLSIGSINPASEYWNGNIAEFILFNKIVNTAERIIIENYLAAKYGLTLAANDIYTMDNSGNGNFDYEVAGIGQSAAGVNVLAAQGTGILRVSSTAIAADGRYFIFGHNNGALTMTGPNRPAGYSSRLARIWRPSESGGDVGATTLAFDVTGIAGAPALAGEYALVIDRDNDGLFSDETIATTGVITGPSRSGNTITFTNVNIANQQRFTLVFTNTVALPLDLLSFTAAAAGAENRIQWQTANAKGVAGIGLERSTDGQDFSLLQHFLLNESGRYAIMDPAPASTSYYRLRILDANGSSSYSAIEKVERREGKGRVQISPNPASDHFRISGLPGTPATIRLLDGSGRLLVEQQTSGQSIQIPVSAYPAGSYLISVDAAGLHTVEQVVVR